MNKRKVLVCGAAGFIGRNTVEHLAQRQDLEVYGTYFSSQPPVYQNIKMIKADLRDSATVKNIVKDKEIIIQMAAITSGAKDIKTVPHIHVTDNAVMNSLIFRAAHDNNIPHVIFPSCSIMYQPSQHPLKEEDFNPSQGVPEKYFGAGWTKVYLEKMCEFYSRRGATKYTVIRHSNVYGPYDKFDLEKSHVFGATITKVMTTPEGGKITIWGDGKSEKDLLYVADMMSFIDLAIEKQSKKFLLVNIGGGSSVSIGEMVDKMRVASGKKVEVEYDLSKASEKTKVILNYKKATLELGWEPKISLEEGIKRTLQWYKENILGQNKIQKI